MLSLLAASLLSGLPTLKPLPPPLAMFSVDVIHDGPANVATDSDSLVPYGGGACAARSLSTLRVLGGGLSMLERTAAWLDEQPGVEARLFGKKGALGEVMRHVSSASIAPLVACEAQPLEDGWRWSLGRAPRLCPLRPGMVTSERWLRTKAAVAAAVMVSRSPDPCQSRVSLTMFDERGQARVRLHADFSGAMAATLVGPACQVELTWDAAATAFKPEWKSCKP